MVRSGGIDGLAHVTGGGLTDNVIRIVPDNLAIDIDTSAWRRPAVFDWLQNHGTIEDGEMLRTFNCGIGMVMLTAPDAAGKVCAAAASSGIECFDIGVVTERRDEDRVRYHS